MPEIDPHLLPYDTQIADLTRKLADARNAVAALEKELDWWTSGRDLYGTPSSPNGDRLLHVAQAHAGKKPTLGDALAIVIATANPGQTDWTAKQILAQLRDRGWLPGGQDPDHRVRAKLAEMARGDDSRLRRVGYGVYALTEPAREWER